MISDATSTSGFSKLVQTFFCERLINQQNVSKRTIQAYRDTFRLLFGFIRNRYGCNPSDMTISNLDADLVLNFLNYLEHDRGNCVRTRNARLAAIRAFFQFTASEVPEYLALISRVLAIPMKRFNRPSLRYLSKEEIGVLLSTPDQRTWIGRRDNTMFTTLYNTGARVSELIGICVKDIAFTGKSASVTLHGKGRKERTVPLWKTTARLLKRWMKEIPDESTSSLFSDINGNALSRSGVEFRLRSCAKKGAQSCPSLGKQSISPHLVRHTTAMHMLHAGVDLSVIALWLGHESIQSTHMYMEADLQTKEKAMSRLEPPTSKNLRFVPKDKLLRFLEGL